MIKNYFRNRRLRKKDTSEKQDRMNYLKTSLKKNCELCKYDERTYENMLKNRSVQKLLETLVNGKYASTIYREATIIFAMYFFNTIKEYDNAYFIVRNLLDEWFEEYGTNKELEPIKYRQIVNIMENPKVLAEEYFQMYNQENGKDTIIVSNSNFNFAYEVNVNLEKGLEVGFALMGYECQLPRT